MCSTNMQGMLHSLTFDIDINMFSFMIFCNTIFGGWLPDFQHNATSNNIHEQLFY